MSLTLEVMVSTIRDAPGVKAKLDVLQQNKDIDEFRKLLYYALNPLLSYNVSEKSLENVLKEPWDTEHKFQNTFVDIFDCCEKLSKMRGMDDATLERVRCLLREYPPCDREVCAKLLAKTLRLGVTGKTVNKIIPGLIPEWEVQQGFPITRFEIPEGSEFWLTQKLNGVRATLYDGKLIARSGQPYKGLDHILDAIGMWCQKAHVVVDGELILGEPYRKALSDNEAFRTATGIINGDDNSKKCQIHYMIFDIIPVEDFDCDKPQVPYHLRRETLESFKDILETRVTHVVPVLYHGTDQRVIPGYLEQMVQEDKEGLMLNLDVPYQRTRHKGILKIKRFYTMDLPIIRCEEGSGRLAGTLGALVVSFQGNELNVGSGFTDEERDLFWMQRDELPGVLCEVKYKEISYDTKTGKQSLQFPVYVMLREDKYEESYG